jgi:23S rRNA (cytosine1962-C5)-methyltransferase
MADAPGVSALQAAVAAAVARRRPLIARWHAEGTDCYRLFAGASEGWPGLAVDRYGPLLLAQEFRAPLAAAERAAVAAGLAGLAEHGAPTVPTWRTRKGASAAAATSPQVECRELGVRYVVAAFHRGLDPWLFLDFRVVRRWLLAHARGRSVLNLFAYTCTAGTAAAVGGAREVWNVDFAARHLALGRANAERNGVRAVQHFVHEDCLPVLRQLAGRNVQRRGRRSRRHLRVAPRAFDLVVLDPPPLARSPFGTVDTARDYESLFKPAWLLLAPGGAVLAANNNAAVSWAEFGQRLQRCAAKAGRPLTVLERLLPEEDFPGRDGDPLLKIALCR